MKKNLEATFFAFLLIGVLSTSCRNDTADRELDWSCADVKARPHPTATSECLAKIKAEQPIILDYYKAVPVMVNGALSHYAMVDKTRHSSSTAKK